ncbi:MAG: hypothetical protein UZ13_00904 [Chloroflexi bacterium OLB13]|nr:MAG: hypothetical protein UZ13_00904 [Chloroflexi bacterium OLB13]
MYEKSEIRKLMGKAINFNLGCVIVLGILAAAIACGLATGGFDMVRGVFQSLAPQPPTSQIASTQTIFQGIRSLGQLVTVKVEVAKAGIDVVTHYGIANVCRVGASHVAQGTIEAGIDLGAVTAEDIVFDEASSTYTIRLPAARLTGCYLDPIATQQYRSFGTSPVCWIDSDEMRRLASYVAINEFRDDALEGGILLDAQRQADVVITSFVRALTSKEVKIEFQTGQNELPVSCQPEPPGLWYFEESSGLWRKR